MPLASVVIAIHEAPEALGRCLAALERAGLDGIEPVLVDNASRDPGVVALLAAWEARGARVLRNPADPGPCAARTQGARAASAPVVVLLDPAVAVLPGWLAPLLDAARDPATGVAGALLLDPAGRARHAGMALVGAGRPVPLHPGAPGGHLAVARARRLTLVGGAMCAVRRDVLLDAGGLDLAFRGETAVLDLCMRLAAAGLPAAYRGDSAGILHGDAAHDPADALAFRTRWHDAGSDRDALLREDGVEDAGWADRRVEAPLFDGGGRAAAARAGLRAMAAAGGRPLAAESGAGALDPDAAEMCDPPLLAALNRWRVGAPPGAGRDGIGWLGALLGRSGYASAGRGMVQAAASIGLPVLALVTDGPPEGTPAPALPLPSQDFAPGTFVVHNLPVMPSGHRHWEHSEIELGLPVIGATCFETEGIPASWVGPCNAVREVWVPSAFNARTFADGGVDPDRIHVVPYPVDTGRWRPREAGRDPEAPFTFLSVFEWTWRKGWDALLTAWAREFAADEPVRLVIVTHRGHGAAGEGDVHQQALAHLRALGAGPDEVADIDLVLDPVPHDDMPALVAGADAFVLPTRGEGAGMPVLEAAACGVPVIATAWGGHEELMDAASSFPVAVERMVEAPPALLVDNGLYEGLLLAEPDIGSLRAAMRAVVDDPAGAAARGRRGRALVQERFSLAATATALEARATALLGGPVAVGAR